MVGTQLVYLLCFTLVWTPVWLQENRRYSLHTHTHKNQNPLNTIAMKFGRKGAQWSSHCKATWRQETWPRNTGWKDALSRGLTLKLHRWLLILFCASVRAHASHRFTSCERCQGCYETCGATDFRFVYMWVDNFCVGKVIFLVTCTWKPDL